MDITSDSEKMEVLNARISKVFSIIPKGQWQYFNKKSLENFVYYFPQIKGISEKKKIIQRIESYLNEIESNDSDFNMILAKELFEIYLYPVAQIYEWRKGFTPVSPLKGLLYLIPMIGLLFGIIYYVKPFVFYIICILFALYLLRMFVKIKSRKVYGLGY